MVNWLVLFIPLVELNIPLNIKPAERRSSLNGVSITDETRTPLPMVGALKSSSLLLDSTPFPKEYELK